MSSRSGFVVRRQQLKQLVCPLVSVESLRNRVHAQGETKLRILTAVTDIAATRTVGESSKVWLDSCVDHQAAGVDLRPLAG
jgi:hypothetical protein